MYRKWIGDTHLSGTLLSDSYQILPIRKIPLGPDGTAYIPFLRRVNEYPKVSLIDVFNGKYPQDYFLGKAVLVGEYGTLIHDSHFAPVDIGNRMPGIEFHANMLESLMQNTPLQPVNETWSNIFLALGTLSTFLIVVYASI